MQTVHNDTVSLDLSVVPAKLGLSVPKTIKTIQKLDSIVIPHFCLEKRYKQLLTSLCLYIDSPY